MSSKFKITNNFVAVFVDNFQIIAQNNNKVENCIYKKYILQYLNHLYVPIFQQFILAVHRSFVVKGYPLYALLFFILSKKKATDIKWHALLALPPLSITILQPSVSHHVLPVVAMAICPVSIATTFWKLPSFRISFQAASV